MFTKAWGVEDDANKLIIETITDTELGAMSRWLMMTGHPVCVSDPAGIERLFHEVAAPMNRTTVALSIFPNKTSQVFDGRKEKAELIDKLPDTYIREMWKNGGGDFFYGPDIIHQGHHSPMLLEGHLGEAVMPATKFFPFIRRLMKEAAGVT